MSKLVMVLGIALLAAGGALGILGLIYPSRLVESSMSMDTPVLLVVGGVLIWAVGHISALLEKGAALAASHGASEMRQSSNASNARGDTTDQSGEAAFPPLRPSLAGMNRKAAELAAGAAAATAATAAATAAAAESAAEKIESTVSPSVAETISALEQAKSDIRVALGVGNPPPVSSVAIPPPPGTPDDDELEPFEAVAVVAQAPDEVEEPAQEEAEELYVVEEKLIRGRPARILSDGTVEAETNEGWMRFENLEHLNEFLDG